jgi:hypothetical protein
LKTILPEVFPPLCRTCQQSPNNFRLLLPFLILFDAIFRQRQLRILSRGYEDRIFADTCRMLVLSKLYAAGLK